MKNNLLKTLGATYLICLLLITVLLPIGGILILARLVGAPLEWWIVCLPIFLCIGTCIPLFVSKIFIDFANVGGGN